jgi:GAF domain-containing protein
MFEIHAQHGIRITTPRTTSCTVCTIEQQSVLCASDITIDACQDASKDSRYSSAWSERGAFATRSALCVPVKNGEGTVIAVVEVRMHVYTCSNISAHISVQVLNKMDTGGKPSAFDASDEKAVQLLASHVAALLQQLDLTAKH